MPPSARELEQAVALHETDFACAVHVQVELLDPSVIRMRLQGIGAKVVAVVRQVFASCGFELERGALGTVKALKTTGHWLPISFS